MTDDFVPTLRVQRLENPILKERCILWGLACRYRGLLNLTCSQFFRQTDDSLYTVLPDCVEEKGVAFCVLMEGMESKPLKNGLNSYTIAFQCPGTCHYYLSLRSVVFKNDIWSWAGHVSDFFIPHFTVLRKDFALLASTQTFTFLKRHSWRTRYWDGA